MTSGSTVGVSSTYFKPQRSTERMALAALKDYIPQQFLPKGMRSIWGENKVGRYIAVGAVVVVGAIKIMTYIKRRNRRKKWNGVSKNVVVLHMFPRGRLSPNLSPFVLKLETYLRMALIPYEIDFDEPIGPKGKCPWITVNGEEIADSQLIIEKLGPMYGKDFSANITPEQRAVGLAMRIMVEEHLFWALVLWRFVVDNCKAVEEGMKMSPAFSFLLRGFKIQVKKALYMQGMGRHTQQEVEDFARKDLSSLSTWLGDKPYFMGDDPTELDCAMFGMLSQIQWNATGPPYRQMIESDFKNLSKFCLRMKEKFWPDWNRRLNPPQP